MTPTDPDEFIRIVKALGAHLRRHQPGGHQGAGVLPHRDRAARADEHSADARRPARHGHHLLGSPAERAGSGGQDASRTSRWW
ncbi:MAG: hypothetical protein WKG07_16105 [Hymenobacter sp.]